MSFYTRKGDDGTTGWLGKGRLPKYSARIEAIGTLDESSAALGLARASARDPRSVPLLLKVQQDLHRLMAQVAASPENAAEFQFDPRRVAWVEEQIETLSQLVDIPKEFILPGDSAAGASLALARSIVRRAERHVVQLFDRKEIANPVLLRYLNRLSSLLFVLELIENQAAGKKTTRAKRGDRPQKGRRK